MPSAIKTLNEIPLESVASINEESLSANTPPTLRFRYIDISSVSEGRIQWHETKEVAFGLAPSRARRVIRTTDVLICTVRPGLQAHAFVDKASTQDLIASTGFAVVRARQNLCARFFYHVAFSERFARQLREREVGTNYPAVTERDVRNALIPGFDLQSQQDIAQCLDTVDDAITASEKLVAKLKVIREGLLHELLTRGIDEDGSLRDKKFQQPNHSSPSPVPIGWEVAPFEKYVADWAVGPRFSGTLYASNGNVATLRTTDMDDEGNLSLSTMPLARLSDEAFRSHFLRTGDVIISRSGTCGITGVFTGHHIPVLPGAFLLRFRLNSRMIPEFARLYMNSPLGRLRVLREAEGGVQKNIRGTSILPIVMAVPPVAEQRKIVSILETDAERIQFEELQLAKLKALKKGLAQGLLTGDISIQSRTAMSTR